MACVVDYRCETCNEVFEYDKRTIEADAPKGVECPKCKSTQTYRIFGFQNFSICEGLCGNYKSGYSSSITYHKNSLVPSAKGKRIK